jgi:hypothetical protein
MLRVLTVAAMFALAVPTLAAAQDHHDNGHGPQRAAPHGPPPGHPGGPPPGRPAFVPHGPVGGPLHGPIVGGPIVGGPMHPGPGPGGPQFSYRGHFINRLHIAPFIYPPGWAYRQWAVGAMLPPIFWAPDYYYPDWAALGLEPPPPGCQWIRYGGDLLLVNVSTGQVLDAAYGVFY